jgi:hypothetical protein
MNMVRLTFVLSMVPVWGSEHPTALTPIQPLFPDFETIEKAPASNRRAENETELNLIKEPYGSIAIRNSRIVSLGRALDNQPKLLDLDLSDSVVPWKEYHNRTFCSSCPNLKSVILNNSLGQISALGFLREYCATDFLYLIVQDKCVLHIIDRDTKTEYKQEELKTMIRSVLEERASEKVTSPDLVAHGLEYALWFRKLCLDQGSQCISMAINHFKTEAAPHQASAAPTSLSQQDDDCDFED